MFGKRVLFIENDNRQASAMRNYLQENGLVVRYLENVRTLDRELEGCEFDLVLSETKFPDCDGLDICRIVRHKFGGPFIFYTAQRDVKFQLKAFELGVDDFVIKPVNPKILLARISAIFRRSGSVEQVRNSVKVGGMTVSREERCARFDGKLIPLSTGEFDVLWLLASHQHQALTREFLFLNTLGRRWDGYDRTVDGRVSRLRKKLKSYKNLNLTVRTVWGEGYLLTYGNSNSPGFQADSSLIDFKSELPDVSN